MTERDGKDQGEDNPKQAYSCWFPSHSWLDTNGANLYPGADVVLSFSDVTFVCFCFVFGFFGFYQSKAEVNRSSIICMCLSSHTQFVNNCLCPLFFLFHCRFLFIPYDDQSTLYVCPFWNLNASRPEYMHLPCNHGLDFDISLILCENSINQSECMSSDLL